MPYSTRIEDYDPATLRFDVVSEFFHSIRHPEDGEVLLGEVYYVRAEAPNGTRWYRPVGVVDWDVRYGEDGPFVVRTADPIEIGGKAAEVANKLELTDRPRLNIDVWEYAGACYGSDAYTANNIEEETAALEREAEYWG